MSVRPRTATRPSRVGIRSVVVEPTSMSRPGPSGISRAARVASASQLLAAAIEGLLADLGDLVEPAVDPPDDRMPPFRWPRSVASRTDRTPTALVG